jgi:hypothetical protein
MTRTVSVHDRPSLHKQVQTLEVMGIHRPTLPTTLGHPAVK